MKVKALFGFTQVCDKEVKRPRKLGEIFEVTKERYDELVGYGLIEPLEIVEKKEIETADVEKKKSPRKPKVEKR